jgi:aromatic ring-opening dioxygenase LigB subunit
VIVFAAIAPHGGPVFDLPESPTRKGMDELGRRFAAAEPDAVIVLTPHGIHVDGHFAVVRSARLEGDAAQWTEADTHLEASGDPELAEACLAELARDAIPALGVTFGATAAGSSTMPLDWGALIPLWFMRAPAVVVSPSRERPLDEHVRAGSALARATGDRRVALIASADHGHGHTDDGPYGYAAESRPYDERIVELVRANRLGDLLDVDVEFVHAALADSFWQLLMLHGAIGDGYAVELLSYEVPTYFGMLTASFTPPPSQS